MSQYTIISKYGKRTRQLKFKKELRNFPSRNNGGRRKSLRTGAEWKGSHWNIRERNTREHKESHKIWHEKAQGKNHFLDYFLDDRFVNFFVFEQKSYWLHSRLIRFCDRIFWASLLITWSTFRWLVAYIHCDQNFRKLSLFINRWWNWFRKLPTNI